MTDSATFKINIKTGDVEIRGSEEFVERRVEALPEVLELLEELLGEQASTEGLSTPPPATNTQGSKPPETDDSSDSMPDTFGEWMHSFRDDISDLEKALITARFVQSQSSSNDFKTSEVNKSLLEHGIKLSNPSRSLKLLAEKKLLFQTRKVGKLRYMRVSQDGQQHLESIKREG